MKDENGRSHEEEERENLHNTISKMVEDKDLSLLRSFGGVEQIAYSLWSNFETGLNHNCRFRLHPEEVWSKGNPSFQLARMTFNFLLKACNSYTVFLFLISAGLCFGTEMPNRVHGPKDGWRDGAAILFAVFLLLTVSTGANVYSARKLEKSRLKRRNKLEVNVVRGGISQFVTSSDVLVGDIVCLKEGDRVPADGLLVPGDGLMLDGVLDCHVDCESNPFLFSGSKVIGGNGHMLVTSVGAKTKFGKLVGPMVHESEEKNLLEARIDKIAVHFDQVLLAISVLVLLVLGVRLLCKKHNGDSEIPELKGEVSVEDLTKRFGRFMLQPRGIISLLTASVAVVAIALQHGLPLAITVTFSYWRERMASEHGIRSQGLTDCGTMGVVSIICVDTTEELIRQEVEVDKFFIGEKDVKDGDENNESYQLVLDTLSDRIVIPVLVPEIHAPIDHLISSWIKSRWGSRMPDSRCFSIDACKRCPEKKTIGVLMRLDEDEEDEKILHSHWKGEASAVLSMCSHYYDCGGEIHAIENHYMRFEKLIKDMEESGLEVIAFAYKKIAEGQDFCGDGLNLLALIGLKYKRVHWLKSAIKALINDGVIVQLLSEDELSLARAIAYKLGIPTNAETNVREIEGEEFQKLEPRAREKHVDDITLMARSTSKDKHLLIKCLKEKGHVVAFCGGSRTSDIAAIREADVGITEETQSIELAIESSAIVIPDGGFTLITLLVKHGRCLYHNIQLFFQLHLISSIAGSLIILITTIGLGDSSINSFQLIWVNVILCILGVLMLRMNPQVLICPRILEANPPGKRTKSLLNKNTWRYIFAQVLYQSVVFLVIEYKGEALIGTDHKAKKSLVFNSFTLCQIFNHFIVMELYKKEVFKLSLQKHYFWLIVGFLVVTHFLVVEFAVTLAYGKRLNLKQWALCCIVSVLPWLIDWALNISWNYLSSLPWISVNTYLGFLNSMPLAFPSLIAGIPFSILIVLSLPYYFHPASATNLQINLCSLS